MDTFKVFIFTAALASLAAAGPILTAAEPNAVENGTTLESRGGRLDICFTM